MSLPSSNLAQYRRFLWTMILSEFGFQGEAQLTLRNRKPREIVQQPYGRPEKPAFRVIRARIHDTSNHHPRGDDEPPTVMSHLPLKS